MLSTDTLLERVLNRERTAVEAEEKTEADAAAATAAHEAKRTEAEQTRTEAADAFRSIRDARLAYFSKIPQLQDEYFSAVARYKAAQRLATSAGAAQETDPVFTTPFHAATYGTYTDRKLLADISAALKRGV